ncbi:hypothetical protein V7S43_018377 [Phytophthora oleae]|uniref:Uncharacterized protein n=1 Tax=Phytophthora oleae TaxID=2107226 RepID=A0ABD3EQK2_9STRA
MTSISFSAEIDSAALAKLLLSKSVEQRYLIWWRCRILYKQSLTVWVKSTSDYGVLLQMLASPLEHVDGQQNVQLQYCNPLFLEGGENIRAVNQAGVE